jgi:transcriptional regulator with XRE-family HTH domain
VSASEASAGGQFNDVFRRWRQHRRLSQLDLTLAGGVPQRHVSWLETGRSQPSREMAIRLAEAMEIRLREPYSSTPRCLTRQSARRARISLEIGPVVDVAVATRGHASGRGIELHALHHHDQTG